MKKAFIDLDGTLLDSTSRHITVLEDALSHYSVEHKDVSIFVSYKADGHNTKKYLEEIIGLDAELAAQVSAYWVEHIEDEKYLRQDVLYDDSDSFLQALVKMGYENIVITARRNENYITRFLKTAPIKQWLTDVIVVSPMEAKTAKAQILEREKTPDSILIGDTEVEYSSGSEAGIRTFLLNRGFRSRKYWDMHKVQSFGNLMEIRNLLNEGL